MKGPNLIVKLDNQNWKIQAKYIKKILQVLGTIEAQKGTIVEK